jgi:hypothetical protein
MAAGLRTVKIRFTGDSKDLDKTAKNAEKSVKSFGDKVIGGLATLGTLFQKSVGAAVSAIPPMGQALAVVLGAGLAAALGPIVGAAISSAVLLAAGGGALALGIKSAMDNPKVAKAFEGLKKKGAKLFDDFGKPFEKPLIRAAATFKKVLDDLRPYVQRIGKTIAPVIDKLAPAFAEFLRKAMPGIEKAVKASVPLFETLAAKLPAIGEAISLFFEKIAANGDDANTFFADLLDLIAGLIVGLGVVIGKLASWYSDLKDKLQKAKDLWVVFKVDALREIGKLLDGAVKALSWIPGIGPKLQKAQKDFQNFQASANKELQKIKDREISIKISTNIGQIAGQYASLVAGIVGKGGKVSGKRASGGPVSAHGSYLVGERGPELLTMGSTSGRITPNRDLQAGGDVYELHVDLGNAVKQVIRFTNRDLKRRAGARGAAVA